MYDPAITPRTLSLTLRRADFRRIAYLRDARVLSVLLRAACRVSRTIGSPVLHAFQTSVVRGKRINHVIDFRFELILRKLNSNLRYSIRHRSQNRDLLVKTICEIVRDTNSYNVLRLDIASFYESVDNSELFKLLEPNFVANATSRRLLLALASWHQGNGGTGLPRGLSTSATLSDIYMKAFDEKCQSSPHFFYYCRYADDILIISDPSVGEKATYKRVHKMLPAGLDLNRSKSRFYNVPTPAGSSNAVRFEYLGYQITVRDGANNRTRRSVTVDIAPKKVAKIKTRMHLSFMEFARSGDFKLLLNRVQFLSGNYKVLDKNGKFNRLAGIFYNYSRADLGSSSAIPSLDKYLQAKIISSVPTTGPSPPHHLTGSQKRELLRNSFTKGFATRGIRNFSPSRLSEIQECWKYA